MKQALDRGLAQLHHDLPALLAIVLSVAPDGVIAWSWSRDHEPGRALGYAALHRAATLCVDGPGEGQRLRRLLLMSDTTWITSRPLRDVDEEAGESGRRAYFVVTTAFRGDTQSGRAVVHAARVRDRIREVIDAQAQPQRLELRDALVELIVTDHEPLALLREVAFEAQLEPARLTCLEGLNLEEQRRLAACLQRRHRH